MKKIGMIALFFMGMVIPDVKDVKANPEGYGAGVCRCHTSTESCEPGNTISLRRRCNCSFCLF